VCFPLLARTLHCDNLLVIASNGTHTLFCHVLLCLQKGWTPLRCAIEQRSDKIVEILIKAGADVKATDKVGVNFPCLCVRCNLCVEL